MEQSWHDLIADPAEMVEGHDANQRQVRGLSSLIFRALLGLFAGAGMGALAFRVAGLPSLEGAIFVGVLGLAVWGMVGVFIWATFPYKSTPGSGLSEADQ